MATQFEKQQQFKKLLEARDFIRNLQKKSYDDFEAQIDELDKEIEKLLCEEEIEFTDEELRELEENK